MSFPVTPPPPRFVVINTSAVEPAKMKSHGVGTGNILCFKQVFILALAEYFCYIPFVRIMKFSRYRQVVFKGFIAVLNVTLLSAGISTRTGGNECSVSEVSPFDHIAFVHGDLFIWWRIFCPAQEQPPENLS